MGGGAVSIDRDGTGGNVEYRCFMTWQDFSRRRNFARERTTKERLTEINTPPRTSFVFETRQTNVGDRLFVKQLAMQRGKTPTFAF